MESSSRKIYAEIDKNGTAVTRPKIEIIKKSMSEYILSLQKEMKEKAYWKKQPGWSIKLKSRLNSVLRAYKPRLNDESLSLSSDELQDIFEEFMELVSWLNETCNYIPTKQDFCAYAEITVASFNAILSSGTEEQSLVLGEVDSYLADMQLSASQDGVQKSSPTEFRMSAKQFGHEISKVSAVDTIVDNLKNAELTEAFWQRKIAELVEPSKEEKFASVKKLKGK